MNDDTNQRLAMVVNRARRSLLIKGVALTGFGNIILGANTLFNTKSAYAIGNIHTATKQQFLDIAVTIKRLAITTYTKALKNRGKLYLSENAIIQLEAALVEEQIHEEFFEDLGGQPLTSNFSYPNGNKTFEDLAEFFTVQQQLESIICSTLLTGIKEMANINEPHLAQILGQIACIEAEHRVLGRNMIDMQPADNYAFAPIFFSSVADTLKAIADAGYLNPTSSNSYLYHPISTRYPEIEYQSPYTY